MPNPHVGDLPRKDAAQLLLSRAGVINIPIPSSDLMGNVHTIQISMEKRRIVQESVRAQILATPMSFTLVGEVWTSIQTLTEVGRVGRLRRKGIQLALVLSCTRIFLQT